MPLLFRVPLDLRELDHVAVVILVLGHERLALDEHDANRVVQLAVAELIDLAFDRAAVNVRERLLCAASLLDEGEVRRRCAPCALADDAEWAG